MIKKLFTLSVAVASGCASIPSVGPDYQTPEVKLPNSFYDSQERSHLDQKERDAQVLVLQEKWWDIFSDTTLTALVAESLSQNLEIQEVQARLIEAEAQRGISVSGFYPQIAADGRVQREKNNVFFNNPFVTLYEAGLSTSWEIDFFGKTRRALEAATAELQSQEALVRASKIKIIASVCEQYFFARGFEKRKSIAEHNAKLQEESLGLVQARYRAGLVDELDVLQAQAQLETTKATIPLLETNKFRATQAIAVLLSKDPIELSQQFFVTDMPYSFPPVTPELILELQTNTLLKRPDVYGAERTLAAATARKGQAIADYFPSLSLGAALGFRSTSSADLFQINNEYWNIVPRINWPLFTGGRVTAGVQVRDAQMQAATFAYKSSVIKALSETKVFFADVLSEKQRSAYLEVAFNANDKAVRLAKEQYKQGLIDFQRVLESERGRFATEDGLIQAQTQQIINFIKLAKALGLGA